jgi:hypothetical protein
MLLFMRRKSTRSCERSQRHPSLGVALGLSLVTETGGPADLEGWHVILRDLLTDNAASDPLRGMAAATLADSARLGRGMDTNLEMTRACMPRHWSLDTGRPPTTLVCTGWGVGTEMLPATSSPTSQRQHWPTSAVVRTQNAPPA